MKTRGATLTTFRLSHKPGDNHRIAATMKQATLYPVEGSALNNDNVYPSGTQPPAQDQPNDPNFDQRPTFIGHISPLLIVWRRLWIEVDSMAPVSWAANSQSGTVQAAPYFDPGTPHAIIPIEDLASEFESVNQHLAGRMDIVGFGSFLTDRTIVSFGDDEVRIRNAPANIATAVGAFYELFDDDKGSDPNANPPFEMQPDYPPVTLPYFLDLGAMVVPYACAYVTAAYTGNQYFDNTTAFDHQVVSNSECEESANANRDLTSSASFWVVHLTAAYQGFIEKDLDPSTDSAQYGLTVEYTSWGAKRSSGSLIFLETIRDQFAPDVAQIGALERLTIVHESGHQFLLEPPHETGPQGSAYIMWSDPNQPGIFPGNLTFSPAHLVQIRTIPYPPQP